MRHLVVDLTAEGQARVSASLTAEGLAREPAYSFEWSLPNIDVEALRWYLEDYLRSPFGVYGDRGGDVARSLRVWGEAAFGAVFGHQSAFECYSRATAVDRDHTQLLVRSPSAAVLGFPWELLWDPERSLPVALDLAGVARTTDIAHVSTDAIVTGHTLRILMVISRPAGGADVGYRTIARPLLRQLRPLHPGVELTVLRPPTLKALADALGEAAAAGRPFGVVHFDGHGVTAATAGGGQPEGSLIFETESGGGHVVPAGDLAEVLGDSGVPLGVLNACKSAAVQIEIESTVATRLLRNGVASVVAMAYSVYATAAAEFMAGFYERLFAGDPVTQAVNAGRRRLYRLNQRPSPRGMMPLSDWMVPVHYVQRDVRFEYLARGAATIGAAGTVALDTVPCADHAAIPAESSAVFVGRDQVIHEVEVATRSKRIAVLHGVAGIGKTATARAFAEWWVATGGAEAAFFHSFALNGRSDDLDAVVGEIGHGLLGAKVGRLSDARRAAEVRHLLAERACLLVWDNFESVYTMPRSSEAPGLLQTQHREALRGFAKWLVDESASTVVIASRTPEEWLGTASRIEVTGLQPDESNELVTHVLAGERRASAARKRRAFGELLEWAAGHPLCISSLLPQLVSRDPAALLARLNGPDTPFADTGEGSANTVGASLTSSFTHLPTGVRRGLVAACQFEGTVDSATLTAFSGLDEVPSRFVGFDRDDWLHCLQTAATVGLIAKVDSNLYRMHPALPGYLAARWRAEDPLAYPAEERATVKGLLRAHALIGDGLMRYFDGDRGRAALAIVDAKRPTLEKFLELAVKGGDWVSAMSIARPLLRYLELRGFSHDEAAWCNRCLEELADQSVVSPAMATPAGALWLFLVSVQADSAIRRQETDEAERATREMHGVVQRAAPSDERRRAFIMVYQRLARIAQLQGAPDDAEAWYRKGLGLAEELDVEPALTLHSLGDLALEQGALEPAGSWYARAAVAAEEAKDARQAAVTYHSLGILAARRGSVADAERWYTKALTTSSRLGNRAGVAAAYQQLGSLAIDQRQFDRANDWYVKALAVAEQLGIEPDIAGCYHQLGVVAEKQARLDDAVAWYSNSLALSERMRDRGRSANCWHGLGKVALNRGQLDEAERWFDKAIAVQRELDHRWEVANASQHLGMVKLLGGNLDEAERLIRDALPGVAETGDKLKLAVNYNLAALVAWQRGSLAAALEWAVRSLAMFEEFPDPGSNPAPQYLLSLTSAQGLSVLEDIWLRVTLRPLPMAIREFIRQAPAGRQSG